MTNKIKLNDSGVSKYLLNKDFNAIFCLFVDKNFSETELLIFYRRHKKILKDKSFWASQLPHFHLQAVIKSDFKIKFLDSYFSSDLNCSDELNKHIACIAKSDFIKLIKLWEVYNQPNFYKSLKTISESDTEFERFVKELDIIIKAQQKIRAQENADEKQLLQFSFGEIALAFTLFYHEFKQSPQVLGNKKWQTSIEMTLVDELHNVFVLFKGKDVMRFQFNGNEELQKEFQRNEAPHHTLGKQGLWLPREEKCKRIFSLINKMIDRNSWKGQIQLYLSGYVDFETTILNPAPLKSNSNYQIFKINNNKSTPEEYYFLGLTIENLPNHGKSSRTDITSYIKTLDFYGIPEFVKHNGNEIEIKKALQLLNYFSVYKGTTERTIFPDKSFVVKNQGDEQFIKLFGSNESITLFDFENLSKGIAAYFKWTEKETENTLSFLTLDVTSSNLPYSWISRPFLKFGNQILWLGSFLKDRRWDNIFLNKFKREAEYESLVKPISINFEKKIETLFKTNGFRAISSLLFESLNGQRGDFDVLAYKDNYLIVCEAKTGTRSDAFSHAAKTEAVRLEGEAVGQLEKAIHNIKEDWTGIKSKLEITEAIEIDDIKIIPMIVTDIFEGDLHLYKNSILKTSLLELEVNLKNKKKELLEVYIIMQYSLNSQNASVKNFKMDQINWDLWDGQSTCTVENLLQNLRQNTIWKELETVWKFEDEAVLFYY